MRTIFFLLLIAFIVKPLLSQVPTKKEIQAQMLKGANELNKQIAAVENKIADAKNNNEEAETIKGMEDELVQLKQQLSFMAKAGQSIATIPASTMKKASEQVNAENDNTTQRIPARKTALLNALPKDELSKVELPGFLNTLHNDLKKKLPESFNDAQKNITVLGNDAIQIAYTGVAAWYNESPAQAELLLTYAASPCGIYNGCQFRV